MLLELISIFARKQIYFTEITADLSLPLLTSDLKWLQGQELWRQNAAHSTLEDALLYFSFNRWGVSSSLGKWEAEFNEKDHLVSDADMGKKVLSWPVSLLYLYLARDSKLHLFFELE